MVGLIWVMQVVHYPLFAAVGRDDFVSYEEGHTRRVGALLIVPAVGEIVTAALIVVLLPADVGLTIALISGGLLALVWVMTGLVQARQHGLLSKGFDTGTHRSLVRSNWYRTAAWTGRGILAAVMLT